jgi:hypothetical protein
VNVGALPVADIVLRGLSCRKMMQDKDFSASPNYRTGKLLILLASAQYWRPVWEALERAPSLGASL